MPQPSMFDVHVDVPLTNMSVAYIQSQDIYIATKVFPIVPSEKKSNKYYVWTKADWFRDEAQLRGDSEESAGGGMGLSTDSYSCDVWAFHKDVGHLTMANADAGVNIERTPTQFVTQRLLLRQEKQWVTDYFTTGVWGTDITGVTSSPSASQTIYWSDFSASDPINDIETAKTAVLSTTGFMPNTLVLGYQVFAKLKQHPDLVDRIKYTQRGIVTREIMGSVFDIPNLWVAQAIQNTANEGQTGSYSFVHGKNAWLGYVNPAPEMEAPSAGYVFGWTGVSQGMGTTIGISDFYIQQLKTTRYEGEIAFDNKVVGTDLGYFFSGIVS